MSSFTFRATIGQVLTLLLKVQVELYVWLALIILMPTHAMNRTTARNSERFLADGVGPEVTNNSHGHQNNRSRCAEV